MGVSIIVEKVVGKKVAGKNVLVEIRDALLSLDRDALGGGLDRVQVGTSSTLSSAGISMLTCPAAVALGA